jgi:hypothetical protein
MLGTWGGGGVWGWEVRVVGVGLELVVGGK